MSFAFQSLKKKAHLSDIIFVISAQVQKLMIHSRKPVLYSLKVMDIHYVERL